ncbi:MAG: glycosyltransferase family 2 protein, partial [Pseudomonadota bacterium]
ENLGFAGGINAGIRYAMQWRPDYLWILNNDTRVKSDSLQRLLTSAQIQPEIAMFGVTVLENDDAELIQCAGGCFYSPMFTTVKNALKGVPVKQIHHSPPAIKPDYIFGAAMFCKAQIFEEVGLFREDYFLFYEELDFTQRLKKAGHDIAWCPEAHIYHQGSASVGSRVEGDHEKLKRAAYYENLNTLKYTSRFHYPLLVWVMIFRFSAKFAIYLLRRDFYLIPTLVKAYRDFLQWDKHADTRTRT